MPGRECPRCGTFNSKSVTSLDPLVVCADCGAEYEVTA